MFSSQPQPLWDAVHSLVDALPKDVKPLLSGLSHWQPGTKSPISTHASVTAAIGAYLLIIFGGRAVMQNQQPLQLRPLFVLHNALLTAGSFTVLALMAEQIVPIIYRDGWFAAICAHASWTPQLETLYIINYMFKYWELGDTVFLVAKKKPLQFLHVFHHTATAVLCYTQLNGRTSVSWVPITLNLTVHVFMYYYYGVTALIPGKKIWWKRYLTGLQISQFVIDLFVVYYASYSYFCSVYAPWMPTQGSCAGSEGAAIFGCALLTSYLFLFIAFYQRTYKQQAREKRARRRSSISIAAGAAAQALSGEGPSAGAKLPLSGHLRRASQDAARPIQLGGGSSSPRK